MHDLPDQPPYDRPIKITALISGGGSTVLNLLDCIAQGTLDAQIVSVICSNKHASGIKRLRDRNIPVTIISRKDYDDIYSFSAEIWKHIKSTHADLVCLAGFLSRILIEEDYLGHVINIHPALLPNYGGKGMFGHHVHEAVLDNNEPETGCTVHFANNEYDSGPIILQRKCVVNLDDTPDILAQRVMAEERIAYPQVIQDFKEGKIRLQGDSVVISD